MKENNNCGIVQDLIPNYIENLTNENTNEFIEKHIIGCQKCEQTLKDMKGDFKLENIHHKQEIHALKKVKNRFKLLLIFSIIITIVIAIILMYIYSNYKFEIDENNKISIHRVTFDSNNISHNKNIIITSKRKLRDYTIDGYVYMTTIITFDETNKCVNYREKEDGYSETAIQKQYKVLKKIEETGTITNVEIRDNSIYYNDNSMNGRDKDKILETLNKTREDIEFDEY